MKTPFTQSRAAHITLSLTALLGAATLFAPTAKADNGDFAYYIGGDYGYKIVNMPDIDQRRDIAPGVSGLPNKGAMYCVPTYLMNTLGYVANHGFPTVAPGPGNWQANDFGQYNTMSDNLIWFGIAMQTDPQKGTGGGAAVNATKLLLDPTFFAVDNIYSNKTYAPVLRDLAVMAIQGRLVNPVIGWYTNKDMNLPHVRSGGHVVTLAEAYSPLLFGNGQSQMGMRDPADDKSDLFTQSAFKTNLWNTQDIAGQFGYTDQNNNSVLFSRTQSRIVNYGSGYIDGALVIKPKVALAGIEAGFNFITPISLFNAENQQKSRTYRSEAGLKVKDVALDPIAPRSPYLVEGQDGIYEIDHLTGESFLLPAVQRGETGRLLPMAPIQIQMGGPDRMLYVLQKAIIAVCSRDGRPLKAAPLRQPLVAISFDQKLNRLFGFAADGTVSQYSPDLQLLRTDNLPQLAVRPNAAGIVPCVHVADDPITGDLWFLCDGSVTVQRITFSLNFGLLLPAVRPVALQEAISPKGIDVDEAGAIFVSDLGRIAAYNRDGRVLANNPFARYACDGSVRVMRSFTNFDPAQHTGPGWVNVLPEDAERK